MGQSVSFLPRNQQKGVSVMFCSQFSHNLDEKNRFKVPASLRDELGVKAYLIKSPDADTKCIFIYSEEGWNELYKQFNQGAEHNQQRRRLARKILSGVTCGEVDKGGRLTLNLNLKEYAGISDSVQIVGNNNHIELWSPEEWAKETEIFESEISDTFNINF